MWVAQATGDADREAVDRHDHARVPQEPPQYTLRRVWLSPEEERGPGRACGFRLARGRWGRQERFVLGRGAEQDHGGRCRRRNRQLHPSGTLRRRARSLHRTHQLVVDGRLRVEEVEEDRGRGGWRLGGAAGEGFVQAGGLGAVRRLIRHHTATHRA